MKVERILVERESLDRLAECLPLPTPRSSARVAQIKKKLEICFELPENSIECNIKAQSALLRILTFVLTKFHTYGNF